MPQRHDKSSVGLIRRLLQSIKPTRDWTSSDAHLLLLSKFLSPRPPEDFTDSNWASAWATVLSETPSKAIARFRDDGAIEIAGIRDRLGFEFRVAELKQLLRQRNLRLSGRKRELIERLIEADREGMSALVSEIHVFTCTEKGRGLAQAYLSKIRQLRATSELEVLAALRGGELDRAVSQVAAFDAEQVFGRGVEPACELRVLKTINEARPQILECVSEEIIGQLRVSAGMMQLWGTNDPENWLPHELGTGLTMDNGSAARMLLFYAQQQLTLDQYRRDTVVKGVEILSADDSCEACRELTGRVYRLDEVPVLPNPFCTHPKGCRCTLLPVTKTYAELGIDISCGD